ncbi:hypothetical protein [Roseomonas acroporae]|uniref:hypothetical protein n=1 Tax=Roseomonas acroporae TaxID=2937791 RepID=UPI0024A7A054|nr:hypothetical protein [Roseomonas acroporae]
MGGATIGLGLGAVALAGWLWSGPDPGAGAGPGADRATQRVAVADAPAPAAGPPAAVSPPVGSPPVGAPPVGAPLGAAPSVPAVPDTRADAAPPRVAPPRVAPPVAAPVGGIARNEGRPAGEPGPVPAAPVAKPGLSAPGPTEAAAVAAPPAPGALPPPGAVGDPFAGLNPGPPGGLDRPAARPAAIARPPRPAGAVPLLGEAALRLHRAARPTLLRAEAEPRVFVLDFPDLESQGAALNRVAALVEKLGLPRDRVLTDAELAEAIARSGSTPATYYFGHDYRGTDLERFFALAARDGVALHPPELWVREALAAARREVPDGEVALISVPQTGPAVDAPARESILRHEMSHGRFFTDPDYAGRVRRVWHERFTADDRALFRRFLAGEGYDPDDEELMLNEAQAYLLHTPDPRMFSAEALGVGAERVERLRRLMLEGTTPR